MSSSLIKGGGMEPDDVRTPGGTPGGALIKLVDVTMPQMGVSVAEGTIVEWRKRVGDAIEADETIVDISTDKIDTEVPAPVSGTVAEILVEVEQTVAVGTVIARIAVDGGGAVPATGGGGEGPTSETVPLSSEGELGAELGGPGAEQSEAAKEPAPTTASRPTNGGTREHARYSPVVQRIAAEHGLDLAKILGTGRGGRVRKQDVLAAVASPPPEAPEAPEPPLHIESPYRPEPARATGTAQRLPRARRQIGEHMHRSLQTAATCTTWIEVDMGRIEEARERLGLTALPFVARAVIAALREHPTLNAWLEGEMFTKHEAVHLGIAVSLGEEGLIVPIVHDAHELSVEGLGSRIRDLARRARGGQLSPDEVRGGTFTITNPGQYGSIMATPIINQPQVAILDLEAVVKRPVVVTGAGGEDAIAIRPMTILGLSWDHRALDGALAAQFLATVKRVLEGWTGG